jgi:hypothetical protein
MEKLIRRIKSKPDQDVIVLSSSSKFPLRVILLSEDGKKEYKLVKTKANKLLLNQ